MRPEIVLRTVVARESSLAHSETSRLARGLGDQKPFRCRSQRRMRCAKGLPAKGALDLQVGAIHGAERIERARLSRVVEQKSGDRRQDKPWLMPGRRPADGRALAGSPSPALDPGPANP